MDPRPAAPRPVLAIGELLIDLIVSDGSPSLETAAAFDARPGGAPANVAVALARQGIPSAFCGVVGEDPFGTRLRATLDTAGVDHTRLRQTAEADTTLAFAWKDARGDGQFRLLRMADRLLEPADVERAGIDRCAAVVVGSVALAAEPSRAAITRAVDLASAARVPVCFDVNMRPTLWPSMDAARAACEPILARTTLLKVSRDDVDLLFGATAGQDAALGVAAEAGAPLTVLTDGSRGAWYRAEGTTRHVPAFAVEAIDPTGAGDAFTAALIARLVARGWGALTDADLRYAAAAGAIATTRRGAMEALPAAQEIASFLAAR